MRWYQQGKKGIGCDGWMHGQITLFLLCWYQQILLSHVPLPPPGTATSSCPPLVKLGSKGSRHHQRRLVILSLRYARASLNACKSREVAGIQTGCSKSSP